MSAKKQHKLNILLLKDQYDDVEQAIKDHQEIKKHELKHNSRFIGTLYIKSSYPSQPKWSSFFEAVIDPTELGVNTNVAAVLLIKIEGKIFAITFGHGRFLLKQDSWIDRFGLIVALNSIGKEKIRTISKSTFDAISRQSKEQASKETDARNFGLDIEQDLLKAVTGVSKDPAIGKRIYGMDSLNVSTDIKIHNISELLNKLHAKYLDQSYKIDFPWVDHICEVKDKSVIAQLNKDLVSLIATNKTDRIWMAVPEFIEWDQVEGFCYRMDSKSPMHQDIHLPDFLSSLSANSKENMRIETFTKKYVQCIHTEGYVMHRWQVYKCLYGELEKDKETYVLSGGKWYIIARDFVANVNQSFSEIPNYSIPLPIYNDDSERTYNERVSEEMSNRFALMDRKNIFYGGGHSQIEFCDLYSSDHAIIHVKHYGASSVFSHLFSQGRLSGELFQMEKDFREKVNEKLKDGFKIKAPQERPKKDEYQVVYAIISNVSGELDIPFFSKLNLKNSTRTLRGLGYRVAKSKIEVAPERAKLKKYKKRRKKK